MALGAFAHIGTGVLRVSRSRVPFSEGDESIESQIADAVTIPAPPKRRCTYTGCTQPLSELNKGTMCFRHAQLSEAMKNGAVDGRKPRLCTFPRCATEVGYQNAMGRCSRHQYKTQPPSKAATVPQVEDVNEERIPMTKPIPPSRFCAVMGCDNPIHFDNLSNRCRFHKKPKVGQMMKDGSVPRPDKKPKSAAPKGDTQPQSDQPGAIVEHPAIAIDGELVTLKFPVEALDRFLLRLPIEDKTRIVERLVCGGDI